MDKGRLEKNFMWLAAANITASIFAAILVIYLARVLEAEYFGYLSYATALIFYLFNFVDLGLSTYGIRQVAKDPLSISEYVSNIVSFRLIAASVIAMTFALVAAFTSHTAVLKVLMVESALMLFCSALATEWAFQGIEKMHMVLISLGTTSFLQLVLNLIYVKGPADTWKVPLIGFFGSLPIIATFLVRLRFRFHLFRIDFDKIWGYLSSSIVIWGVSVFAQAYNGLDIVMLGFFRKPEEVGCFTVARRISGGAGILMILLANAVLPRLSCTFTKDLAQFRQATAKFLKIAVLMIILVFLPLAVFSRQIISFTVGSEYVSAGVPLSIMAMALVLVMFNLPFSTGLIAACFEKDVLKQAFSSAALSLILNLVLMPKYGMIGASISFLLAETLALVWILTVYNKRIRHAAA